MIYYGSFPGGTKQGLHRNEQPPPTQQGAFSKGKGAVVANAVTPRRLGLRIYGNAVSAQRISVNLGAAPCSQCSQGSAAR